VDVERARFSSQDLVSRGVSLFREEHIFLFHLGHNIGMPLNLFVINILAVDSFTHLDQVRRKALEGDYCVPWLHSSNRSKTARGRRIGRYPRALKDTLRDLKVRPCGIFAAPKIGKILPYRNCARSLYRPCSHQQGPSGLRSQYSNHRASPKGQAMG
jgi:hypothetical protein